MAGEIAALPDDVLAVNAWQAGDNDCFAELFTRHRKKVFYACRGFFWDSQAAEDATQETFLRAYKNIRSFQEGDFSRWLLRIAKNVCIDEWRRRRPETAIDELGLADGGASKSLDPSFESRQMAERLWLEIKSLPCEQRQCLELKVEGFTYEANIVDPWPGYIGGRPTFQSNRLEESVQEDARANEIAINWNSAFEYTHWRPFCKMRRQPNEFNRTLSLSATGELRVPGHGLGPGTNMKFFVNAADISVDRRDADLERFGNFLVKKTVRQQFQHFPFARRKALDIHFGRLGSLK